MLDNSTLPSPGYSMWNPWNGGWIQMDSMEWLMDSMDWLMDSMDWLMDSMDFPDGFHGMADGFHGISRWIPYCFRGGVHVESIWNEFMES